MTVAISDTDTAQNAAGAGGAGGAVSRHGGRGGNGGGSGAGGSGGSVLGGSGGFTAGAAGRSRPARVGLDLIDPGRCLRPGTTIHYRFVATNGDGTSNGADAAFMTVAPFEPWDRALAR